MSRHAFFLSFAPSQSYYSAQTNLIICYTLHTTSCTGTTGWEKKIVGPTVKIFQCKVENLKNSNKNRPLYV